MSGFPARGEAEALAEYALGRALKGGAGGADVIYCASRGNALSLLDGEIEECAGGSAAGIGVRTIISDGRQGIAYGSRLDKASVGSLVEWSLHNALAS